MKAKLIVHLTERPARCTACGATRVGAHDKMTTKYYGTVQIYRCAQCREHFYVYVSNVLRLLAAAGVREYWDNLVQMLALIALGMPLTQIENLTGRKQETILSRFQKCRISIPLWKEITSALKAQFKFRERDIRRVESFTPRAKDHDSPFHLAFVSTPKPNLTCDAPLRILREGLHRKTEEILQREIAYTGAGEFYLADIDARQIPWVRMIRAARLDQLQDLDEPLREIALRVRSPDEKSHTIAPSKALVNQTAPILSLAVLCDGFYRKVPLPVFFEDIKAVAKFLYLSA